MTVYEKILESFMQEVIFPDLSDFQKGSLPKAFVKFWLFFWKQKCVQRNLCVTLPPFPISKKERIFPIAPSIELNTQLAFGSHIAILEIHTDFFGARLTKGGDLNGANGIRTDRLSKSLKIRLELQGIAKREKKYLWDEGSLQGCLTDSPITWAMWPQLW